MNSEENNSLVNEGRQSGGLVVQLLDLEWQSIAGVNITEVKTYGCGVGSEYVYCYSFPTCLEIAKLKREERYRIKVGKAESDPIARIYQQCAGNSTAISELPMVLLIFRTLASRHLERWLHKRLERAADAIGSEWFHSSPSELVELFREYVRQASIPSDDKDDAGEIAEANDRSISQGDRLPRQSGVKNIDGFKVEHPDGRPLSFPLQLVHVMWANMQQPITVEDLRKCVAQKLGVSPEKVPAKFDQQIDIELGRTGRNPRFQFDSANRLVLVPGQKMPSAHTAKLDGSQRYE